MAGKKDHIIIAVVRNVEDEEALNIARAISKSKRQNAPHAMGRAVIGEEADVKNLLGAGVRRFLPWKNE